MRLKIIILFLLVFAFNQSKAQKELTQKSGFTKTKVIQDLRFLDSIFSKVHPFNFPNYNEKRLENHIKQINSNYLEIISPFEVNLLIRAAIDTFSCVHTYIAENPLRQINNLNYFPKEVFATDGKIYLIQHKNEGILQGDSVAEIVQINKRFAKEDLQKMLIHHCPDGNSEAFRYECANFFSTYYLANLHDNPKEFILETIQSDGSKKIIKLLASDKPRLAVLKKELAVKWIFQDKYSSFGLLNDSTALLKITEFKGNYKFKYRKIFKKLSKHKIPNLVIDLKDNLGGIRKNGMKLLSYLIDKKLDYQVIRPRNLNTSYLESSGKKTVQMAYFYYNFQYLFQRSKTKDEIRYNIIQKPNKQQYVGNIFVLTNGFTASTSSQVVAFLKDNNRCKVIGQQSAGGESGNFGGTFQKLTLPNSKIIISFPLFLIKYNVLSKNKNGIIPDYITQTQPSGTQDEEIKKALELIAK